MTETYFVNKTFLFNINNTCLRSQKIAANFYFKGENDTF